MEVDFDTAEKASWGELFDRRHFATLAILCFGVWLHAADSLLVATLMPSAVRDIGGVVYLSWTFALYELASIVAAAATGLLVSRTGLRNVMAWAAAIFTLGCALSALSPDMGVMLVGRLLQGTGGGMMLAGTFVGMRRLFPERLWIRVVAAVSAIWGTSALVGPLVGGLFASWDLWRDGFWAFGAQSVIFGFAVLVILKREALPGERKTESVPWYRLGLLALGVLAVSAAGAHVAPVSTAVLCLLGLAGLFVMIRRDGASANRIFAARPWSLAHTPGAATVMVLMSALATTSFTIYGPFLMQALYGADPLTAGYYIASESVAWSLAAVAVSGAKPTSERTIIRAGSVLMTVRVVGFAVIMPTGPMAALLPFAIAQGAGFGMAWGFVVRHAIAGAPERDRDRISSSMPTVQMIGYALGAAAVGIVANASGFAQGLTDEAARSVGIWVFAAFVPVGLWGNVAAWRLTELAGDRSADPQSTGKEAD